MSPWGFAVQIHIFYPFSFFVYIYPSFSALLIALPSAGGSGFHLFPTDRRPRDPLAAVEAD